MTATRDNQRAHTLGPTEATGQLKLPVSADEMLELLEMTFGPAATPVHPGGATVAYRHVFKPSNTTPSSATLEVNDGARIKRLTGAMGNQLQVQGNVHAANEATVDLFAADYQDWGGPLTTLSDRVPTFFEGWQTNVYLDALGGTPGTTLVSNAALNWNVQFQNQLGRKYWAGNTLATGGLTTGEMNLTASIMLEAAASIGVTEFTNWDTQVDRLLRLEFLGPANEIETGFGKLVWFDIPGAWATVNLSANDAGTRTYDFNLQYLYDPALAAGIKITCQTARASAFA